MKKEQFVILVIASNPGLKTLEQIRDLLDYAPPLRAVEQSVYALRCRGLIQAELLSDTFELTSRGLEEVERVQRIYSVQEPSILKALPEYTPETSKEPKCKKEVTIKLRFEGRNSRVPKYGQTLHL